MLSNDILIKVTNREKGSVSYQIPDMNNLRRVFEYKESKVLPMEELRKLTYQPGGTTLLRDCLILDNQDAIDELLGIVEPEYYYTEDDIIKILQNGTEDQFEDCLTFAPEGVVDLIKDLAVKLKINDVRKRELILEKTGFNVTRAIEIDKETSEEKDTAQKVRKAATPVSTTTSGAQRKTTPPAYKVVEKK